MSKARYDHVRDMAMKLDQGEQLELIGALVEMLRGRYVPEHLREPLPPLRGLIKLIPAISAQDIDEARHEMWGNFPREDVLP